MFANRYTALIDACVLAGALKRNLILSLAQAEFFRVRWSDDILREAGAAIERYLHAKGVTDAPERARRAVAAMNAAFEEAAVVDHRTYLPIGVRLPDPNDAHVVAAALKTRASVIVTDNLKHFPADVLEPLNLDVRSADGFIADTITLDVGRALATIRRMRQRFKNPEKEPEQLLLDMEAAGLTATVDALRPYMASL